jgi:hypothetical protein
VNQDPEIQAMASINDALSSLQPEAAARVIIWAADRYHIKQITKAGGGTNSNATDSDTKAPGDLPTFYSQARPKTHADNVLVVCFWLQEVQKISGIDAQTVNKELKHLGHGIPNITGAFDDLINSSPALAIQIRKSGKTRQARKKYKLTEEGLTKVKKMIGLKQSGGTGDES